MKDYTSYHKNSIIKMKHDAKVISQATFRGLEIETVLVNNLEEMNVFFYDKYSSSQSLKYAIDENNELTYGDVLFLSNGEKWIIVTYETDNPLYTKWVARLCQHTLKWIDEDSVIHHYPCVIDYNTKSNFGEKDDRIMTLPDGRRQIILRKDDNTIKLKRSKRFILGDEAFEIVDYDFISDIGLMNLSLKSSQVNPSKDNVELGIADYFDKIPVYELRFNTEKSISINLNQTLQLSIQAFKNDRTVDLNEINLSSSDPLVGVVDQNGLFTPTGIGLVSITAEYMGLSESIEILVRDILINNYSTDIIGSDDIVFGQTKSYQAAFNINGAVVDETAVFTLSAEDGISKTNLASIKSIDGNTLYLVANNNSKSGIVKLKVVSNNRLFEGQKYIRIKGFI